MLKTLATLVKLHRFEVEEQQRALSQLTAARAQTAQTRQDLDAEIAREQAAARADFESLQALPAYMNAARQRIARLEAKLTEFDRLLELGREELQRRFERLKSFELAAEAEAARAQAELNRREQQALDETASQRASRED